MSHERDDPRGKLEGPLRGSPTFEDRSETTLERLHALVETEGARNRRLERRLASATAEIERLQGEANGLRFKITTLEATVARQGKQVVDLAEIRKSRSYRLMRVLWRLNCFRRRSVRGATSGGEVDQGSAGAPAQAVERHPATAAAASGQRTAESGGPDLDRENGQALDETGVGGERRAAALSSEPVKAKVEPARKSAFTGTTKDIYEALDKGQANRVLLGGDVAVKARSEPRSLTTLRVAAVLDSRLRQGLADSCDLVTFRPDNWRFILSAQPPNLLLVESALHGNGGSWQYQIEHHDHPDARRLDELVSWCRDEGVPTVFWDMHGMAGFPRFFRTASLFDHVFTVDPAAMSRYVELLGDADRCGLLPPAARPADHRNPAGASRDLRPAYIGSYSRAWPAKDRHRLELLLDAARPTYPVIYDSSNGLRSGHGHSSFPARFDSQVSQVGSYQDIVATYRTHAVTLAADLIPSYSSADASALDALSNGAAPVCLCSKEREPLLDGSIPLPAAAREVSELLDELLTSEAQRERVVRAGRRALFGGHTYEHRLATIAARSGLGSDLWRPPSVAVIAVLSSADEVERLVDTIAGQSLSPAELVISVEDDHPPNLARVKEKLASVAVSIERWSEPDWTGAHADLHRTSQLSGSARAEWVTLFAPGRHYHPDHLSDLFEAGWSANTDVIAGRTVSDNSGGSPTVNPDALLARAAVARRFGLPSAPADAAAVLDLWRAEGVSFLFLDDRPAPAGHADASSSAPARRD